MRLAKTYMAGQLTGKDLAIALAVRGNALMTRRDTDKAIAAYSAAHDADPAAPQAASYRCITYAAMARFGRAVVRHNRLGNAREQVGKIDHQRSWPVWSDRTIAYLPLKRRV